MDIEKTVKTFLTREHINYSEGRRDKGLSRKADIILHCLINNTDYNIVINEDGLLSVTGICIIDKPLEARIIASNINSLNTQYFGSFYWESFSPPSNHPEAPEIFFFYCQYDQLFLNGITINEQLVEDIFVEVNKGIKAIKDSIPDDLYNVYEIDESAIIPDN